MFEILKESKGPLIAVKVSGKLNVDDYEKLLIPKLNALFKEHGKLSMLVEFTDDFAGWDSLAAAWDDMKLGLEHPNDFEKLALVGAPEWVEWGMKFFGVFVKGEVKAFPPGSREAALKWLG